MTSTIGGPPPGSAPGAEEPDTPEVETTLSGRPRLLSKLDESTLRRLVAVLASC